MGWLMVWSSWDRAYRYLTTLSSRLILRYIIYHIYHISYIIYHISYIIRHISYICIHSSISLLSSYHHHLLSLNVWNFIFHLVDDYMGTPIIREAIDNGTTAQNIYDDYIRNDLKNFIVTREEFLIDEYA